MKLFLPVLFYGFLSQITKATGGLPVPLETVNTESPTEEPTPEPTPDCTLAPEALISWSFDDLTAEVSDPSIEGDFELEIVGDSYLDGEGRLICDGSNSQVRTIENIPFTVTSPQTFVIFGNTLDLTQAGGGIMAVDGNYDPTTGTYSHNQFDSLVYNEISNNGRWMTGSEFFSRTNTGGFEFTETGASFNALTDEYEGIVSLILVYDEDGNSRFFRDCEEISPENTVSYDIELPANYGKFLFCERHTDAGGGDFEGVIENAAYYNYALSDDEIQAVCQCNPQ